MWWPATKSTSSIAFFALGSLLSFLFSFEWSLACRLTRDSLLLPSLSLWSSKRNLRQSLGLAPSLWALTNLRRARYWAKERSESVCWTWKREQQPNAYPEAENWWWWWWCSPPWKSLCPSVSLWATPILFLLFMLLQERQTTRTNTPLAWPLASAQK